MSLDDIVNQLGSGEVLKKQLISSGKDLPTQTARLTEHVKSQLESVMGSDAEHVIVTPQLFDENHATIRISFAEGHEGLADTYGDDIRNIGGNLKC